MVVIPIRLTSALNFSIPYLRSKMTKGMLSERARALSAAIIPS